MTVVYVDGGCSGNGQRDLTKRQMVMVVTDPHGQVLSEERERGGSNNIAELAAIRDALVWCRQSHIVDVEVCTDSRNNFSWVYGKKVGRAINDRALVLKLKD